MQESLEEFKKSEEAYSGLENKQICFIIGDGKMNKDYVRPYMREAKSREIIYVFIIVDSEKQSILTTKSAAIDANGKVKMKLYMSDFPFEYFLIVRNVKELGDVLATTLLQFIQQW
jgi:midasin